MAKVLVIDDDAHALSYPQAPDDHFFAVPTLHPHMCSSGNARERGPQRARVFVVAEPLPPTYRAGGQVFTLGAVPDLYVAAMRDQHVESLIHTAGDLDVWWSGPT